MRSSRLVSPKLAIAVSVLCALLPSPSRAQPPLEDRPVGSLQAGDWALQFQIGNNLTLQSFDGLLISLERHWSPRSAFRLGLDLNASVLDNDSEMTSADSLARYSSFQEQNGNHQGAALLLQYVSCSNPQGRLHFYWAAGPRLSYARSHGESINRAVSPTYTTRSEQIDDSYSWGTGLGAALGIQWFAARGLGLLAEYGASAGYNFGKTSSARKATSISGSTFRDDAAAKTRDFRFNSTGVRFGVGVQF